MAEPKKRVKGRCPLQGGGAAPLPVGDRSPAVCLRAAAQNPYNAFEGFPSNGKSLKQFNQQTKEKAEHH